MGADEIRPIAPMPPLPQHEAESPAAIHGYEVLASTWDDLMHAQVVTRVRVRQLAIAAEVSTPMLRLREASEALLFDAFLFALEQLEALYEDLILAGASSS